LVCHFSYEKLFPQTKNAAENLRRRSQKRIKNCFSQKRIFYSTMLNIADATLRRQFRQLAV